MQEKGNDARSSSNGGVVKNGGDPKHQLPLRNDNNTTFSACLLVMDDNHFLIEWLAYHYVTLPLRYLIITVDPRSKTRPDFIFERYDDITIVEWNDTNFLPQSWINRPIMEDDATHKFVRHRERQRHFYPACMEALRDAGRSWTTIIDSDEYVRINRHYIHEQQQQPTGGKNDTDANIDADRNHDLQQPATVIDIIQQDPYHLYHTNNNEQPTKCIMMPRLRYGNYENKTNGNKLSPCEQQMKSKFPIHNFQTLRWKYHANLHDRKWNRNPKSIINVQRITEFSRQETDAHRPVRSACPQRGLYVQNKDSPLVVQHYIGTWEQYSFRKDARDGMKQRNAGRFEEHQLIRAMYDDTMCDGWLSELVRLRGIDHAQYLLEGVGDVHFGD